MNHEPGPHKPSLPDQPWSPPGSQRGHPWRKLAMALLVVGCLAMSVIGGLLPILQGWIFFVIALYVLATEFESGRRWVTWARRRWPWLSTWITRARNHRWAPRHLQEFDDLTDPRKR